MLQNVISQSSPVCICIYVGSNVFIQHVTIFSLLTLSILLHTDVTYCVASFVNDSLTKSPFYLAKVILLYRTRFLLSAIEYSFYYLSTLLICFIELFYLAARQPLAVLGAPRAPWLLPC